jgi:hypothetical protein
MRQAGGIGSDQVESGLQGERVARQGREVLPAAHARCRRYPATAVKTDAKYAHSMVQQWSDLRQ